MVGEMRDLETISMALTAAETGHLVFATLHTQSAPQTVDRIVDVFPPDQQGQISPSFYELCVKAGDFKQLAEVARINDDASAWAAGKLFDVPAVSLEGNTSVVV